MTTTTIPSWISGAETHDPTGHTADVTNPATGAVTGTVVLASAKQTVAAVGAAAYAFPGWRDTSLARRTQVIFGFRGLSTARGIPPVAADMVEVG